jgi:general secretion pathway protein D
MLSPVTAAAFVDGKKHFSEGMKHEAAEEWDKAVEEFALAVTETPKNPEYKLHLSRALFNASQMFMKKGTSAANEKDYVSGYAGFRRAYAYDPKARWSGWFGSRKMPTKRIQTKKRVLIHR